MTEKAKKGPRAGRLPGRLPARQVLFTGFPGFLGKRLVNLLLDAEPASTFYLVVQPKFQEEARAVVKRHARRRRGEVHLLAGDIADLHLGLSSEEVRMLAAKVTDVYHLAAISYLRVPDDYMWRVNVQGTQNMLDLAGEMRRLRHFNHMSTCYVSGNRQGVVMEDELECGQMFRNLYEKTKFEAEKLVRKASGSLPISVFRPAVVVGDSHTGEVGRFDGPYTLGLLIASSPVTVPLPGGGVAPVHLVPVDYVSEAVYRLSLDERAKNLTFHIVDPNPLSARRVYQLVAERTGKRAPVLKLSASLARWLLRVPGLEKISRTHRQAIDFISSMVYYNHANTDRLLAGSGLRCPAFESYLDRLIEYARATFASRRAASEGEDPLA